jgi:hypothetical protein
MPLPEAICILYICWITLTVCQQTCQVATLIAPSVVLFYAPNVSVLKDNFVQNVNCFLHAWSLVKCRLCVAKHTIIIYFFLHSLFHSCKNATAVKKTFFLLEYLFLEQDVSDIKSVCLSVTKERRDCLRTEFREILYLGYLEKCSCTPSVWAERRM